MPGQWKIISTTKINNGEIPQARKSHWGTRDGADVCETEVGGAKWCRTNESSILLDITERASLDHGADEEALDGLILGGQAAAAVAVDSAGVATTVLGAAVIAALLGHLA